MFKKPRCLSRGFSEEKISSEELKARAKIVSVKRWLLMINWLKKLFARNYERPKGILLYGSVQEVILVNTMLVGRGFQTRLVAPPPEVRVGCDLAIEFELIEQEAIETLLGQELHTPEKMVSTKEMLPDILKVSSITEIDGFLMCKAGNMKITVDKEEHRIVNISGGGCPDIPYVAHQLQGIRIEEAKNPIDIGNSLCSFILQISFDALKERVMHK
jgi:hypothetical protein